MTDQTKRLPKVLILDPSREATRILTRKLAELNCEVEFDGIASHALGAVRDGAPDVVLLELCFEDPTGIEICEAIRENRDLRHVPIIIYTDRSTRRNVIKSVKSGAKSVIVKPASTETIVKRIHDVFVKLGREDVFTSQVEALELTIDTESGIGDGSNDTVHQVVFTEKMDAQSKLEKLLGRAKEVKAMPFGVSRTLEVSEEEASGAPDMAQVIETDPAISAMVLKRANSAHYAGQKRTVSAKDAVVRIGFSETRNLVMGLAVIKNFDSDTKSLGFQRGEFWEHSLAVGSIAKILANKTKTIDPGLAFVAGLIHDVGKLIFDEYMTREFEKAIEASGTNGIRLDRAEREMFEINHTEVGQALLEKWRFPDLMADVALYHNSPKDIDVKLDPEYRPLLKLIYVANALAKAFRIGDSGDQMLYPITDQFMQDLQLQDGLPDDLAEQVQDAVNEFREFLSIPPCDDAPKTRKEFKDRSLIFLQDPKPIVDPYEFYLGRHWGFEIQRAAGFEALDDFDDLENAFLVLQAADNSEDRAKYDKLFSNPFRGHVLLLLEPAGFDGDKDGPWPTDHVTTLKKPVDGRMLISTLSQMCQQTEAEPQKAATE